MDCGCGTEELSLDELVEQFDVAAFRQAFAEYADPVQWPEAMIREAYANALCYVSPKGGTRIAGHCRSRAIDLMTAHLLWLQGQLLKGGGNGAGMVSSAGVDKVSVTLTPPPIKNQFQWWLSLSGRGQELLALLKSKAGGGLYVGGLPPEREAFRKAGGVFRSGKGHS